MPPHKLYFICHIKLGIITENVNVNNCQIMLSFQLSSSILTLDGNFAATADAHKNDFAHSKAQGRNAHKK